MRIAVIVSIGLAVVSVLPGCIEFERQIILLKLDAESDVLKARLIYQGIYAGGKKIEDDLKELSDVVAGGTRFFLFDNWPLEVDIAKPEKGAKDKPGLAILRPHTTVKVGRFFLDDEGRLSAWQDIEIRNISKILAQFNRLLNLAILTGQDKILEDADEETQELCKTLALEGHEWIRLDGDGLHVVFHVSEKGVAKLKRDLLESLAREVRKSESRGETAESGPPIDEKDGPAPIEPGEDETATAPPEPEERRAIDEFEAILRVLSRNPLSWNHRGHELRLSLSPDEKGVIRGRWWNEGPYVPNLLEPAEEGGTPPKLPAEVDRHLRLEMLLDL